MSDFLQRFEEFAGRSGWAPVVSPWDVVERSERLVEVCASCYQWGFYEFDNEVRVRSLLDRAFGDPRLTEYPQLAEMERRVQAADEHFRQLLSQARIRDEHTP